MTQHPADNLLDFYRRAHGMALGCAALHLLICFGLAAVTGTWLLALVVGVPALFVPWWLSRIAPADAISRLATAIGFMTLTGLAIQQTGGDLEAHFSFFLMMSVLVVYCDWRVIVAAFACIAVHHLAFTVLQPMGLGFAVWGDRRAPWGHFLVHAVIGAVQTAALSYLAVMMRRLALGSLEVASMAQSIAEGRLTMVSSDDTHRPSVMTDSMYRMQQRLADMLGRVRSTASTLSVAVQEIAQGASDLSTRTEHSAARTQSVSAELMHYLEGSKIGLQGTIEAGQVSQHAGASAEQAGAVVARVVETMRGIETSSGRIADIIGVIDSIAFRTNILALNAAVEAARAGEQGRGFAVVASEVRGLAQRSAEAAREIRALIQGSSEQVAAGNALVRDAGGAMDEVVTRVRQVGQLIQSAAARVQADRPRLESLGVSLREIDDSMQHNASFVEQLSATMRTLRDQENALSESLETFSGHTPVAPLPAPPAAAA